MNLDEVVTELRQYIGIINAKKIGEMSGDDLSKLVVKLASYNSTLGEYVADAERAADYAEASFDLKKEKAYAEARKKDEKVADSDNIKRLESMDEKGAWIEAKYQYKVLAILRADVNNLIDAIRSRLSFIKSDKEKSYVQV